DLQHRRDELRPYERVPDPPSAPPPSSQPQCRDHRDREPHEDRPALGQRVVHEGKACDQRAGHRDALRPVDMQSRSQCQNRAHGHETDEEPCRPASPALPREQDPEGRFRNSSIRYGLATTATMRYATAIRRATDRTALRSRPGSNANTPKSAMAPNSVIEANTSTEMKSSPNSAKEKSARKARFPRLPSIRRRTRYTARAVGKTRRVCN